MKWYREKERVLGGDPALAGDHWLVDLSCVKSLKISRLDFFRVVANRPAYRRRLYAPIASTGLTWPRDCRNKGSKRKTARNLFQQITASGAKRAAGANALARLLNEIINRIVPVDPPRDMLCTEKERARALMLSAINVRVWMYYMRNAAPTFYCSSRGSKCAQSRLLVVWSFYNE